MYIKLHVDESGIVEPELVKLDCVLRIYSQDGKTHLIRAENGKELPEICVTEKIEQIEQALKNSKLWIEVNHS